MALAGVRGAAVLSREGFSVWFDRVRGTLPGVLRRPASSALSPGLALLCCAMLSLAPLNGLAYLALADPRGLFGSQDTMTAGGYLLTGLLAAGSVLVCLIARRSLPLGRRYAVALCLDAMLPLLVLGSGEESGVRLVAGALNGWIAYRCAVRPPPASMDVGLTVAWLNVLVLFLILALVGYGLTESRWAHLCLALLCYAALAELRFVVPPSRSRLDEVPALGVAMLLLPLLILVVPILAFWAFILLQTGLLLDAARRHHLVRHLLESLSRHPARMFAFSFTAIILLGTLVLTLPASSASGTSIGLLDALFTSTSATCVTGLAVLDTSSDFSLFGQVVILTLIQIGALGMLTISSFVSLILGRRIGLRAEAALGQLMEAEHASVLFGLIRFIVVVTLSIEAAGTLLLALVFMDRGHDVGTSLWYGLFHSVSAFCNAGFALFSDSLIGVNRSPLALLVVGLLIAAGGLGYGVLSIAFRRLYRPAEVPRFPLHVHIVLFGSAVLWTGGALAFLGLEWDHSLAGLPLLDRVSNAVFQSVTCRTAGFNSLDYSTLSSATVFMMLLLMFVGGCPNSTAGGAKVTTVMVLYFAIVSTMRGRDEVEAMGRSLPQPTVYKSAVIIALALLLISAAILVLLATQEGSFDWIVFEVFSAFGTVGLSLGMTTQLDAIGRLVVIGLMFAGRIGPLTLVLLLESSRRRGYRLPEASILVG